MFDKPRKITTQTEADNIFRGTCARDIMILSKGVDMYFFQPFVLIALRTNLAGFRETLTYQVPLQFMPYGLDKVYDIHKWNFDTGISTDEIDKLAKAIF